MKSAMVPVVGYEGLYSVTRDGRVWAYPKKSRSKGRWMKESTTSCGYSYVGLFNGKRKNQTIHRIVALAYIPRVIGKPHVNHINGVKKDNRVENLEWCTPKENKQHAWRTGITSMHPNTLAVSGKNLAAYNRSLRKLSPQDVRKAKRMAARGLSSSQIAPSFNVSRRTISRIIKEGYR